MWGSPYEYEGREMWRDGRVGEVEQNNRSEMEFGAVGMGCRAGL